MKNNQKGIIKMGRFQAWYASKRDAEKAYKERKKKNIESFAAEVFDKKTNKFVAYYVGMKKSINGLTDKYTVKFLDWK